jgi:hypothetical protein
MNPGLTPFRNVMGALSRLPDRTYDSPITLSREASRP